MKRGSPSSQCDLFSGDPTAPALASAQLHHDELVELLSRLLWEVACGINEAKIEESRDEQDRC